MHQMHQMQKQRSSVPAVRSCLSPTVPSQLVAATTETESSSFRRPLHRIRIVLRFCSSAAVCQVIQMYCSLWVVCMCQPSGACGVLQSYRHGTAAMELQTTSIGTSTSSIGDTAASRCAGQVP